MTDPDPHLGRRVLDEGLLKRDDLLRATPPAPDPGQAPQAAPVRLGRYEVVRLLGQGAAGEVYLARDPSVNREVAVKVLRGTECDQRFQREVEILGVLRHPNIVGLYDTGTEGGLRYFVMERIEGSTLQDALRAGALPLRDLIGILRDVALACHAAHEKGIVHRDLKPSNILLDRTGRPYVTDFGIAKMLRADERLTLSGTAMGTPRYMSPEQAAGHADRLDARSDVYSLGVMLYEMLTGAAPFTGKTFLEIAHKIIRDEPRAPSLANRSAPKDLEAVTLKAIEKAPERRYPTAKGLADDLQRWLDGRPVSARPPSLARRAARWCRRHPVTVALAGAAVVLLVVLAVVQGRIARQNAWKNRQRETAQRINDELRAIEAWQVQLYKPPKDISTAELSRSIEAIRQILSAGGVPPDYVHKASRGIARAHEWMGRTDLALDDLSNAIRQVPPKEAGVYHFDRARLRWEIVLRESISKKDTSAAAMKDDLKEALRLGLDDPWQRDFAQTLLDIMEKRDHPTLRKAKEACERLASTKGKPVEEARKLQGDIALYGSRSPLIALDHYKQALESRRSYVQAKVGEALARFAWASEGDRPLGLLQSLNDASDAVDMCPAYGETYELLWLACRWIMLKMRETEVKKPEEALKSAERLISLFERGMKARPDLVAVQLGLGAGRFFRAAALAASKKPADSDLDKAQAAFEAAMRMEGGEEDARAGLDLVERARSGK